MPTAPGLCVRCVCVRLVEGSSESSQFSVEPAYLHPPAHAIGRDCRLVSRRPTANQSREQVDECPGIRSRRSRHCSRKGDSLGRGPQTRVSGRRPWLFERHCGRYQHTFRSSSQNMRTWEHGVMRSITQAGHDSSEMHVCRAANTGGVCARGEDGVLNESQGHRMAPSSRRMLCAGCAAGVRRRKLRSGLGLVQVCLSL